MEITSEELIKEMQCDFACEYHCTENWTKSKECEKHKMKTVIETLFPPEENHQKIVNRCRSCEYIRQNFYNHSMKYCGKQNSNKTYNGLLKIKANNTACYMYEKKEKDEKIH